MLWLRYANNGDHIINENGYATTWEWQDVKISDSQAISNRRIHLAKRGSFERNRNSHVSNTMGYHGIPWDTIQIWWGYELWLMIVRLVSVFQIGYTKRYGCISSAIHPLWSSLAASHSAKAGGPAPLWGLPGTSPCERTTSCRWISMDLTSSDPRCSVNGAETTKKTSHFNHKNGQELYPYTTHNWK